MKVCISYVIKQEEGLEDKGEHEVRETPARETRAAPPRGSVREERPETTGGDFQRKSYFTKKLERKLDERAIKVPAAIIALLDKPFEDFTADEQRLYESEFKGRQLTILFSDILDELYEETGRVASGWNAMCRYLKDTPMKLISTYVVHEEERLEEVAKRSPEEPAGQPVREKLNVKRYQPAQNGQKESQQRRHRK